MRLVLRSMVKSEAKYGMKAEFLRTCSGDLSLCGDCRTACSSQCGQKTDLIEETRQYIYISILSLTCALKWVVIFLFNITPAGSWTQDLLALIPCRTVYSSQCNQKTDLMEETGQYIYTSTTMRNLLGDLLLIATASASGGDNISEVQSSILQGKNLRSGLNWMCLAMTLLKTLFCERLLFLGWKPKIFDRATMMLVHCFLLKDVTFGEAGLLMLYWWC
jgi:hypothetical protein